MSLEPGKMVAQYRLVEKIGEGGMGVVWRALDTKLNRTVALKFLPAKLTGDEERRLRFQREAQAVAALDHPSIAVVYETGEHEGAPFISMQHVAGKSLRERVRTGRLPAAEWGRVASSIAEGLAHAHVKGIVHRDLKPDNVMITDEGQVKILDFGLARILEADSAAQPPDADLESRLRTISRELTRAGKVMGTAVYMSPEQARGEIADHRSDLFSLGVVLYEMASGELPFRKSTEVETLAAILNEEPKPLAGRAEIPGECGRIVHKLLEKEPARRYQSAADLVADLSNLRRDLDSGRVSFPTAPAPVSAAGGRPRRLWLVAGLAAVAVLAAGIVLLRPKGESRSASSETAGSASRGPVAVVGFENVTDPADEEHLGRALMGLVTTDLAERGGLEVVSTSKILAATKSAGAAAGAPFDAAVAPAVARGAGAAVMVVGQVTKAGDRILLTAEIVDVASGNTLGSLKEEAGSSSELFSLAGSIASGVRGRLGAGTVAAGQTGFGLVQALTSSPAAYRSYVEGETYLNQGNWAPAAEGFETAIREDPTFALAYYKRAIAYWWLDKQAEAAASLRKGLEHVQRLPERWQTLYRAFLDLFEGDRDRAYRSLTKLVESSSDLADAHYLLGELTFHLSRYQNYRKSSAYLEKALEIDPSLKLVGYHLADCALALDDTQKLRDLIRRLQGSDSASFLIEYARQILAVADGDLHPAIQNAERLTSSTIWSGWNLGVVAAILEGRFDKAREILHLEQSSRGQTATLFDSKATLSIATGRFREAISELDAAARAWAPDGSKTTSWNEQEIAVERLVAARLLEMQGRRGEGIATLREAIEVNPWAPHIRYELGLLFLDAGSEKEAAATREELHRLAADAPAPGARFYALLLDAATSLAGEDVEAASLAMKEIDALGLEARDPMQELDVRARLRLAAGDRSGAAEAYEKMLLPITLTRGWNVWGVLTRTRALYELARLEEEAGDRASARAHYEDFLARWGNADLKIPEVDEARRRLAALGK